jgi:hypothetical protein
MQHVRAGIYAHVETIRTLRTRPDRSAAGVWSHLDCLVNVRCVFVNKKTRPGPRAMRFALPQDGPVVSVVSGRVRFCVSVEARASKLGNGHSFATTQSSNTSCIPLVIR